MPSQALGDIWAMEIEWRDLLKNRSYILTDYVDMPNKRETVVVSHPFAADAKLHIDYNTRDVTVEDGSKLLTCKIKLFFFFKTFFIFFAEKYSRTENEEIKFHVLFSLLCLSHSFSGSPIDVI